MNPIDPRRSERHLLANVYEWGREHGWRAIWASKRREGLWTWTNAPRRPKRPYATARRITFDGRQLQVTAYTESIGWRALVTVEVSSITRVVDVLVALDILPAWLSSAYGLAEDRYREQVETLTEELERAQGAYRDVVAGWAERADMFAVGARVEIGGPR